ncbi:hypothetical protein Tco_1286848 [Tanacetum coccineum]
MGGEHYHYSGKYKAFLGSFIKVKEVPANMFRSSFRDGLRGSVSHLPVLTDSIILILVLSSLAEVHLRL